MSTNRTETQAVPCTYSHLERQLRKYVRNLTIKCVANYALYAVAAYTVYLYADYTWSELAYQLTKH